MTLEAVVGRDGTVGQLRILSSDNPAKFDFERAALAAVRQWRYVPATRAGEPVDVVLTVRVEFDLK